MSGTVAPLLLTSRDVLPAQSRPVADLHPLVTLLPAVLLFYSALLPAEVRVDLAGQTFYAQRIMGFALLPWIVARLVRVPMRFLFWDYLFFAGALWMVLAFIMFYGPQSGILRGGALAFDTAIPYLLGRMCFTSITDFRRFLIIAVPGLLFVGLGMLAEVAAAQPLIRPIFASIFGELPAYENGVAVGTRELFIDQRLGILRASGPFSHPILAGLFLATFFPLFMFSGIRRWPVIAGVAVSLCAVFSASSAAFLALILCAGLLGIDYVQRFFTFLSWRIIMPVIAAMLATIHVLTENGLINFFIQFTLNPSTGRFRRLIWEYGTLSVERHPWFGIGFTDYERLSWMVPSIDNHWLLLAVRFGAFPAFAIGLVALAAIVILLRATMAVSEAERQLKAALAIAIFSVITLGFSVAFFGGAIVWFYMLIAIGISIGIAPAYRALPPPYPNPQSQRPLELVHSLPDAPEAAAHKDTSQS